MRCEEAEVLLHALADGELDAGHARDVEAHVAGCPRCAQQLREIHELRDALAAPGLRFAAPARLRAKIEEALPALGVPRAPTSRRALLQGFALGTGLSAALAASVMVLALRRDDERRILGEAVSAHLRSLQAEHLTDVQSTDRHTVKPWFNGRVEIAPPVADLTAQGFTLIGGRLDYLDGKPVPALVYRRRAHVINVFVVAPGSDRAQGSETVQGFNVRRWTAGGLQFIAVSDLNAGELEEFERRFAEV